MVCATDTLVVKFSECVYACVCVGNLNFKLLLSLTFLFIHAFKISLGIAHTPTHTYKNIQMTIDARLKEQEANQTEMLPHTSHYLFRR